VRALEIAVGTGGLPARQIPQSAAAYNIKGNPIFRNVAHDPRYKVFLRKMKLRD
jgi:hypothetical protein